MGPQSSYSEGPLTTVVEKIVTYAAAVWAHPMQSRKIKHLSTIQRPLHWVSLEPTARRLQTRSTCWLAFFPLHIRVEEEAARQIVLQLKRPVTFEEEYFNPEDYEAKCCPLKIHPAAKGTGISIITNPTTAHRPAQITIFTDGSKIDENVGSAYVVMLQDTVIDQWKGQLRQFNSVFQGEAVAIAQAIRYLQSHHSRNATIKTDSLSSLYAIGNPDHPSDIIQGIQEDLRKNSQLHTRLEWIKAHAGHHGNELADHLAKEAATGATTSQQINIPWPVSYLKRTLRLKAIGKWQQTWDNSDTGRRTYYHVSYVDTTKNFANMQL
ncbi:uncharacterized protein LOC118202365, partial [Stegodyphus dumicola]|uniref:uncharacterized protein LOC118202365 n=1 Tax=Stegodyphus dumicola TaxID=202533 RepID=UPI0015AAE0E9